MVEDKRYYIEMDAIRLADNMCIDTALLLAEAIIKKYHCDISRGSVVSIGEMESKGI